MQKIVQLACRRALLFILIIGGGFTLTGAAPQDSLLARLARPEFEGRGVGTEGLARARDMILAEVVQKGWKPGFTETSREGKVSSSYLQKFQVFVGNHLGQGNALGTGELNTDFIPLAFSKSGSLDSAPLVFAGYGISLRNAGAAIYDDYEGIDVTGKIVVVLLGDPAIGAKDSVFRSPAYYHYSTPMYKVQNAEIHGAAGVILVRDPLSQPPTGEPALRFLGRQGGGANVEVLAQQAKIAFAELLIGKSLKELQEKIAATQMPQSFISDRAVTMAVDLSRELGDVENIGAFFEGTDPALKDEVIVIGAHYDHLGFGGDSSLDPDGAGKVHPGADDNASGVQMVMNLAERIAKDKNNRRSVLALFFTAEEVGLLGSSKYVEALPLPAGKKVVMMLNLDMVGRLSNNKLSVLALKSGKEFTEIVNKANQEAGFQLITADSGFGSSDHASFLKIKIPSLFVTTGSHVDYHRTSDTADKINWAGMARVEGFAYSLWQQVDQMLNAPTYDPSSEDENPTRPGRGYGVYFGSIPEFQQGDVIGVLLQGVRPDSPAERAGLRGGDILVGLGEIKIRNLNDFVFALRYYRPNEEVNVEWMRNGARMNAKTILLAREEK